MGGAGQFPFPALSDIQHAFSKLNTNKVRSNPEVERPDRVSVTWSFGLRQDDGSSFD